MTSLIATDTFFDKALFFRYLLPVRLPGSPFIRLREVNSIPALNPNSRGLRLW